MKKEEKAPLPDVGAGRNRVVKKHPIIRRLLLALVAAAILLGISCGVMIRSIRGAKVQYGLSSRDVVETLLLLQKDRTVLQIHNEKIGKTHHCSAWEKIWVWCRSDVIDNTLYECRSRADYENIASVNIIIYADGPEAVVERQYSTFSTDVTESGEVALFRSELELEITFDKEVNENFFFITGELINFTVHNAETEQVAGYLKQLNVREFIRDRDAPPGPSPTVESVEVSDHYDDPGYYTDEVLRCASNQVLFTR